MRNFKGCLWNSIQNILPIHWNIRFSYNVENLRALTFRSVYAFFNSPKSNRHYIQCTGIWFQVITDWYKLIKNNKKINISDSSNMCIYNFLVITTLISGLDPTFASNLNFQWRVFVKQIPEDYKIIKHTFTTPLSRADFFLSVGIYVPLSWVFLSHPSILGMMNQVKHSLKIYSYDATQVIWINKSHI